MKLNLQPTSQHLESVERLVGFLAATTLPRSAIYVSAPITTGKRFSDWHQMASKNFETQDPRYRNGHVENVIEPNRARASSLVARLRSETRHVVIDPTSAPDFDDWTQDDYRFLWGRVIERCAARIVFVDGWEYSNGCAYEFLVGTRLQLPMFTEMGETLSLRGGIGKLRAAIGDLATRQHDIGFLSWVADECEALSITDSAIARR